MIGAGVLGLSTANLLQTRLPHDQIIIVATELPTSPYPTADYASMWAGAHYRPVPRSSRQLEDEAEMAMRTADTMKRIAKETPEAGVEVMKGVEYLENPPPENLKLRSGDIYAGLNDQFCVMAQHELPEGVKWGCAYDAYCVNVPMYCRWLMYQFQARGGRVVQQRLNSAEDAFDFAQQLKVTKARTVVNCSGRNFDHDPKTKVIRGQTVLVKQQYDKTVTRQNSDGSWSFLIPRPQGGGTIVGGSKEVEDLETQARPQTRDKLLHDAAKNLQDFVDTVDKFDVLKDNVGRRPWREGGLRIGIDQISPEHRIVHGYGAGGRGYELSWGAAERIVELVLQGTGLRSSL